MKTKTQKLLLTILTALAVAAVACFIAGSGLLYVPDGVVNDALYQRGGIANTDIVVVGMDQRALDEIGPLPWSRHIMAEAIEYINSDPEGRIPAAIGVDTLYVGESADPDADAHLVSAAGEKGNVVLAAVATYDRELVVDGDDFYMSDNIVGWDEPFDELYDVTRIGHINAMEDQDAILRHAMLYESVPGYGDVYSFARVVYEMYCEKTGRTANADPATESGFYYIPYTAAGGGYYDNISVADLLNGTIDPAFFADKVVLIGPYAVGMQDSYPTSIDHAAPMYGIEFQANLIDAFDRGFFPQSVSDALQLVILFAVVFGSCFFYRNRKVRWSVIYTVLLIGGWILICVLMYRAGHILHVLWIPLFVLCVFVGSVALNYVRAQLEKKKVTNTFGHYIDPAIMKQLLEQGSSALKLGGQTKDVAALFVDVRGFTTMSEALDPETVIEIINRYLTLTTDCIMRNHGTLDKFVGDCTMALWNAPVEQEDPVYLACCAAMDMVEGSAALGKELQERFGRTVDFGIGVNWGPAVIGNVGAPKRMDYTAIGDTINTAARLEANAPGGQVLISRAVADILGDRAVVTSLGDSIKLKGKAEGFEILRLESLVRKENDK